MRGLFFGGRFLRWRERLYAGWFSGRPLYYRSEPDYRRLFFLVAFLLQKKDEGYFSEDISGRYFFWFTRKDVSSFSSGDFSRAFPRGFDQFVGWLSGCGRRSFFRNGGGSFRPEVDVKARNGKDFSYKDDVMIFFTRREWEFLSKSVPARERLFSEWESRGFDHTLVAPDRVCRAPSFALMFWAGVFYGF